MLRFGSNGSTEVNTREGWFADYEANVRGGVLDLIAHKAGIKDHSAQFRWLEEHGIKEASNDTGPTQATFYDYQDETGVILFKVERRGTGMIPPFLQHAPDGRGGFHAAKGCMQGVRRVLYRLPELLASDRSAIVFVCGGEKDADRAALAQVDLDAGRIYFACSGEQQSSKGKVVGQPIPRRLMTFLRLAKRRGSDLGYVVHNSGERIKDIGGAWDGNPELRGFGSFGGACKRAGLVDVWPRPAPHLRHMDGRARRSPSPDRRLARAQGCPHDSPLRPPSS